MKEKRPVSFKSRSKQPKYLLLISYLCVLMFINGVMVAMVFAILNFEHTNPGLTVPPYSMAISIGLAICNMLSLWALLHWKKWGFWGYCLGSIAMIPLSVYLGTSLSKALLSLVAIFILYSLYQIGGKKKAWNKLK
jgi:hypothetical protein